MKKIIFLITTLLMHATIAPIFETHPWIVITNKTDIDLTCRIQTRLYQENCPDEEENFTIYNDEYITDWSLQAIYGPTTEETYLAFDNILNISAGQTITLNPMLYNSNNEIVKLSIESIATTYKALQITSLCSIQSSDQQQIIISYTPETGIITQAQTMPLYIKLCSKAKNSIINAFLVGATLAEYLPY